MRSDDLAPLLAAQPVPGVGYRQGIVRSWDPLTAQNTVEVAGSILTDLPILNTNEAQLLQPGDVVGILTAGSSWAILGRLTIPGTPEAASALSLISSRIVAASDATQGTRTSSTYGDLTGSGIGPSVTVNIGSSGKALAFWSAQWGGTGDWETYQESSIAVAVSGATTIAPTASHALGFSVDVSTTSVPGDALIALIMQSSMMHLFTGLNPGSNTFTLKYRNVQNVDAVRFETREIAVFAL